MKFHFHLSQSIAYCFFGIFFLPNSVLGQHNLENSFEAYKNAKANTPFGTEWISCGPVLNSARVEAVQAHPNQPKNINITY